MFGLGSVWEEICNYVIRPHRFEYAMENLGPRMFMIGNKIFQREDIEIKNKKGVTLQCSHFRPARSFKEDEKLPCVVYLHGNCGSRCDALSTLPILLPMNITVFCFDFSGCGLSNGKWVTLGYFEQDDVRAVLDYLRKDNRTSQIVLWGRSMGAATALICAGQDTRNELSGIICDSPFISLHEVIISLVKMYVKQVPKTMIRLGISAMRRSIMSRAKFDINKLVPIEYAEKCEIPMYIGHAWGDKFIDIAHAERLHEAYGGQKSIIRFEGDHNSERPDHYLQTMRIYLANILIVNNPQMPPRYVRMLTKRRRRSNEQSSDEEEAEGEGPIDEFYPQSPIPQKRPKQMVLPRELLEEEQMTVAMIESAQGMLETTTDENLVIEMIAKLESLNKDLEKIRERKSQYKTSNENDEDGNDDEEEEVEAGGGDDNESDNDD